LKIPLVEITSTPRELVFLQGVQLGDHGEMRLVAPVDVRLEHYRSGSDLFFDGTLGFDLAAICGRCLEGCRVRLEKKFDFVLTPDTLPTNKNRELNRDEMDLSFYTGDEIDLAPFIQEQTLLGLPSRPLCKKDCLGLCPDCGVNRNQLECSCRQSSGDARMAVFRNLRVNR